MLGLLGDGSQGSLTITGLDGQPAPIIAARTYNQTLEGTYGQSLAVFGPDDVAHEGVRAYLPGLVGSASPSSGFRTNIGLANLGNDSTRLLATLYDDAGTQLASRYYTLEPTESRQSNVFTDMGLGNQDVSGSLIIEVLEGGPVAGYASIIEGRTNDPMLLPLEIPE
jgi:hypothetical protein